MSSLFWPIVLLFGFSLAAFLLSDRAMKLLSPEEKGRLVEATSATRKWKLLLLGVVFVAMAFPGLLTGLDTTLFMIGFGIAIFVPILMSFLLLYKKMKVLELPETFRRKFLSARLLSMAGVLVFLIMTSLKF